MLLASRYAKIGSDFARMAARIGASRLKSDGVAGPYSPLTIRKL